MSVRAAANWFDEGGALVAASWFVDMTNSLA